RLATPQGAANNTKLSPNNAKQAAALQAAAVHLKPGSYSIQNVATGQRLYYTQDRKNNIYPDQRKSTPSRVTKHSNRNLPWHRLAFGRKNKCLSSAWGSTSNNAAVMYVCASGQNAQQTTLEKTKQWWLFVPVSKPTASAKSNSYQNTQLIAAQADSIETRNKKIAAQKAAFNKRGIDLDGAGRHEHRDVIKRLRRRQLEKRANKTVSSGTFYILPTDHLVDTAARALTGKPITTRGIRNTQIQTWKKGNKLQQWRVTRH
ncbi:hypothetical protein JCM10212_001562, partial [Sporobolomyces blumeae]